MRWKIKRKIKIVYYIQSQHLIIVCFFHFFLYRKRKYLKLSLSYKFCYCYEKVFIRNRKESFVWLSIRWLVCVRPGSPSANLRARPTIVCSTGYNGASGYNISQCLALHCSPRPFQPLVQLLSQLSWIAWKTNAYTEPTLTIIILICPSNLLIQFCLFYTSRTFSPTIKSSPSPAAPTPTLAYLSNVYMCVCVLL